MCWPVYKPYNLFNKSIMSYDVALIYLDPNNLLKVTNYNLTHLKQARYDEFWPI